MRVDHTQRRVLDALQGAARSWDELKAAAKLNDARLGFILGQLLNQRLIWTGSRDDLRLYGIERRAGVVPRRSHPERRATDLRQKGIKL